LSLSFVSDVLKKKLKNREKEKTKLKKMAKKE